MRERRPAHRLGHDRYKWDCYGDMQDQYTPIPRKRVRKVEKQTQTEESHDGDHSKRLEVRDN
jgi:hypothetical protein